MERLRLRLCRVGNEHFDGMALVVEWRVSEDLWEESYVPLVELKAALAQEGV